MAATIGPTTTHTLPRSHRKRRSWKRHIFPRQRPSRKGRAAPVLSPGRDDHAAVSGGIRHWPVPRLGADDERCPRGDLPGSATGAAKNPPGASQSRQAPDGRRAARPSSGGAWPPATTRIVGGAVMIIDLMALLMILGACVTAGIIFTVRRREHERAEQWADEARLADQRELLAALDKIHA